MLILLISLLISGNSGAVSLNLRYERNQFATETLPDGTVRVTTKSLRSYPVNYGEPALPWIYMTVDIPVDADFSDLRLTVSDRELMLSDITMETLQYPVTTDVTAEELNGFTPVRYSVGQVYPSENVRYVRTREYDGRKEVCLLVSPLSLNSADGTLWINKGMDVELTTKPAKDSAKSPAQMKMAVSSTSRNLILSQLRYDLAKNNKDKRLDYLIITVDSLANAFEPLLIWKRKKGLNADLLTLNTIYSAFSTEKTPQLKIKRCIQMLKDDYGLKYVLLGGDGYTVPCQYCYGKVENTTKGKLVDYNIPTDLFYSTFKGNFDWNANGNELIGELEDNVIISPEIAVSRLPIHTISGVEVSVDKIMEYEKYGNTSSWNNKILFSGADLKRSDNEVSSEPYNKSNLIYTRYISPYWNGGIKRVFSNSTDAFPDGQGWVDSGMLTNEFSDCYLLADINCHGSATRWWLDYDNFEEKEILNISSANHYFPILSVSCFTNTYGSIPIKTGIVSSDWYRTLSLAEIFIKSPNSGVIAYLGNTREGMSAYGNVLGTSESFNSIVYNNLFSSAHSRLSLCLNDARSYHAEAADVEESSRWVMFSLNLSGDPETSIFTNRPLLSNDITVSTTSRGELQITKIPTKNYSFRIGYRNNLGLYQYSDSGLSHPINLPSGTALSNFSGNVVSVSLSSDMFLPLNLIYSRYTYWKKGITYLQDFRINNGGEFYGKNIIIGNDVCEDLAEGDVVLQGGKTLIVGESVTLAPGFEVKKGAELTIQPMLID